MRNKRNKTRRKAVKKQTKTTVTLDKKSTQVVQTLVVLAGGSAIAYGLFLLLQHFCG
jgi:hypothetical protein